MYNDDEFSMEHISKQLFFKTRHATSCKKNNPPAHLSDYSTQKENKLFIAYILQY